MVGLINKEAVVIFINSLPTMDFTTFNWSEPATAVDDVEFWRKSVKRGPKLLQGMSINDKDAATRFGLGDTCQGVLDENLKDASREWEYTDNIEESQKLYEYLWQLRVRRPHTQEGFRWTRRGNSIKN